MKPSTKDGLNDITERQADILKQRLEHEDENGEGTFDFDEHYQEKSDNADKEEK